MTTHTPFSHEAVDRLLTDSEPWLSCDDCFDGHDAVVEQLLASNTPLTEPFRVHFNACSACLEDARSLAALIAPDHALSPDEAVDRLDTAITGPAT